MQVSAGAEAGLRTVSVLVPTYRRPLQLQRCLEGLGAQTRRPDEVLVVVRPEDEASRSVLTRTWDVVVHEVLVDRPGAVAARNTALEVAIGDIVAFLDDDAVPRPDWLARLVAHYDDPAVGAVGGRDVLYAGGEPVRVPFRRQVGVLTWYGRFVTLHPRGSGPAHDVEFLKGVNMSISRVRSPDVRFDEHLRGRGAQVHEDAGLCLEVRARGLRVVYDPAILVDHHEADRGDNDARAPQDLRARRNRHHNQTYLVARHYPWPRVLVHVVYAVVVGMADAPGLLLTARDVLRTRTLRGRLLPLVANVQGRLSGLVAGVRTRRAVPGPAPWRDEADPARSIPVNPPQEPVRPPDLG